MASAGSRGVSWWVPRGLERDVYRCVALELTAALTGRFEQSLRQAGGEVAESASSFSVDSVLM